MAKKCGRLTAKDTKQAVDAYGDLRGREGRQLMWLSKALPVDEAARLMREAVPQSYNEFSPTKVAKALAPFRKEVCVRFGREYSPVLYIEGTPAVLNRLSRGGAQKRFGADEMSRCTSVRITPSDQAYRSSERRQQHQCVGSGTTKTGTAVLRVWFD